MSSKGDEIGAEIAAESAARSPWPAVGDAVAARLGRTLYYFSAAAVVGFPQSLQGSPPAESVLTASPTAAVPAIIAQAAMPVGMPNLAIWPAHTMMLHLWTFAPLLPTGKKYSILAMLRQVDAFGTTVATLKTYPINGDADFPDDIWSPNWARTDLAVELPQVPSDASTRLEIDLTLFTSCTSALPVQLQIGGDFASYIDTSLTSAGGGASVPLPIPPDTYGGKLYTANIADAFQRPSVDCLFRAAGGCVPYLFQGFTQIATGVWRKDNTDPMADTCDTDGVTPFVGMRVLAWSGALTDDDRAMSGPYVVDNIGGIVEDPITHVFSYNHAQLHRAPDADSSAEVYHGLYQAVLGGTVYEGMTLQLSTADPIELNVTPLTWAIVSPPTPAPTKELLTAAQLSLATPTIVTASAEVGTSTGEQDLVTCTEHDAVLGGAVIPGDQPFRFHVRAWVVVDDPEATTTVRCYLRGTNGSFVLVATTQALHNTTAGDFVAVGTWGSDYPLDIGEKLEVVFRAVSNSATSVRVDLTYNDAPHSTFIEIPMAIGYAGTTEHDRLTPASRALPDQHPMSAITPGWLQTPTTGVTVAGGLLPLASARPSPVTSNTVDVSGTGPLVGVETTGKNYGDALELFFLVDMTITNQGTPGTSGYAGIAFGTMGLGSPPQDVAMKQYSTLRIALRGGIWRPVAPWYITETT